MRSLDGGTDPDGTDGSGGRTPTEVHGSDAKPVLLVSACLLGVDCNFRGGASPRRQVEDLAAGYELVPVCPEVAGGLPVPRDPAEITSDGRVVTATGQDVTAAFRLGADTAVELARSRGAVGVVLKARSPSCGPHQIYDGTHSGRLIDGQGITAAALREAGFDVLDEDDIASGRLPEVGS